MEASQAERRPFIDASRLSRSDYLGFTAAAILGVSLFLPWFSTTSVTGSINGERGTFNAFGTYNVLDILLAAACIAPFILAYIVMRRHELSWRPGEVTAIVGLTAFFLIVLNGIVLGKPGEPDSEIGFEIGYPIGLVGSAGIAVSGFLRQLRGTKKQPPGV